MSYRLLKNQVFAGLYEMLVDDKMYHKSMVGDQYCHFTDQGKEALIEYMTMMAPHILRKQEKELEKMAKEMTWKELKK